ncbi:MAG: MBL fold metallo-hydrolase, partial [Clostridia bacterium]|nr:MBL fold metallo-hydrolase [Clostridia bacterium]
MKVIKNNNYSFNKTKLAISIIMIVLLLLSFFFSSKIESALGLNVVLNKNETTNDKIASSKYEITYLDVGQGNSAFIRFPDGKVAIVDGGNYMYGDKITRFLKEKDVKVVDYIIATHADADHISGLISVLDNFEVKHILRPFQISGTGTSAETFEIYEYEDLGAVYEYYQTQTNNKSKISRVTSNVYKEFIRKTYCETYLVGGMETKSDVTVFYDGLKISGDNYVLEFFAPLVRDDEMDLSGLTNTNGYATVGYGVTE